ncbi:hypothetical protein ACU61A_27710 [Pseudonocardia sichuanensis]
MQPERAGEGGGNGGTATDEPGGREVRQRHTPLDVGRVGAVFPPDAGPMIDPSRT